MASTAVSHSGKVNCQHSNFVSARKPTSLVQVLDFVRNCIRIMLYFANKLSLTNDRHVIDL